MADPLEQKLKKSFKEFDFEKVSEILSKMSDERVAILKSKRKWKNIERAINNPNNRGPDFLIAGTQKGGTSSLDYCLRQHPNICMSFLAKELHFFDQEKLASLEIYHKCFSPDTQTRIIGETTPTYMYFPEVPLRIFNYNPQMKLIVLLRDPIKRLESQWNMVQQVRVEDNKTKLEYRFQSLWQEYLDDINNKMSSKPGFIHRSMYFEQVKRLLDIFPKQQLLFLTSESFRKNPKVVLAQICNFLGVDNFNFDIQEKHVRRYTDVLPKDSHNELSNIFEKDVNRLKQIIDIDTSDWFVKILA